MSVELASFEASNPSFNPISSPGGSEGGRRREDVPPKAAPARDAPVRCRLLLALFAVSLMWMCSLSVAVAVTGLVVSVPATTLVRSTCDDAYATTKDARSDYVDCVDAQLDRCETAYVATAELAFGENAAALRANAAALDAYAGTQAACSAAVTTAMSALDAWQSLDTAHAIPYVCDDCAAPCDATEASSMGGYSCDCGAAKTLVGDVGAVRSEAFATASSFAAASTATVDALAAYAAARAAYDAAYVANKTARTRAAVSAEVAAIAASMVAASDAAFPDVLADVDLAAACLTGRSDANGTTTCPLDDARDVYDDYRMRAGVQVDLATKTVDAYADEAAAYQARVAAAFGKMVDFYDGVTGWIGRLGIDAPIDEWIDFGVQDFYAYPGSWPDPFPVVPVPGAGALYPPSLQGVYDALLLNITAAAAATRARAAAFGEQLAGVVDVVHSDDYDPPVYADYAPPAAPASVENASAAHASSADAFLKKQAVSLNAFAELSRSAAAALPRVNATRAVDAGASILDDLRRTWFDWAPLAGSEYDVDLLFVSVGSVTSLLVLLDYCWRGFQTVRVFRRFLGRSAVALPRPDMSLDRSGGAGGGCLRSAAALFLANPAFFLANVVLSPAGALALLGVFAALVLAALAQAYVPLYAEYANVCVAGGGTRGNGTFLAQNLYAVAYNYAAVDGRAAYAEGVDLYDARRSDHCAAYATASGAQSEEDALALDALAAAQGGSSANAALLRFCVDAAAVDAALAADCCGRAGYEPCVGASSGNAATCPSVAGSDDAYGRIGPQLSNSACDGGSEDWAIPDATFDCSSLPTCDLTCGGPSEPLLRLAAQHCACTLEWWFHACWLRAVVAFVVYALTNGARVLVVNAVCKLHWRDATPNVFTYTATCDAAGWPLLAPGDRPENSGRGGAPALAVDGAEFQRALRRQLKARIIAWERTAALEIAAALLLNAPWIALLAVLWDSGIAYDP